jgi:hypothetical protein
MKTFAATLSNHVFNQYATSIITNPAESNQRQYFKTCHKIFKYSFNHEFLLSSGSLTESNVKVLRSLG